ncbi:hypothetical protein D187_003010 [Cystobacter fuscus DSM 2262]|uniref:Uncharacterized protein n=1 Tax=Cystobacter fuscus (strain ATCC 25194 / DSM 2262 / NBRC 100088 / M29) TaxID=1242864 RepID=S9P4Z8_CYSF2|nr:hypothetical protein D187_003010 [Cystobacter fuscus DSM 2262]
MARSSCPLISAVTGGDNVSQQESDALLEPWKPITRTRTAKNGMVRMIPSKPE